MYAPFNFEVILMKASAETFNECDFLENLYIYVYIYSFAQFQYVMRIDIETQKKHFRLNVSAKAFISIEGFGRNV